jgi:uncharacterized membrane protein YoaK (UPF0700 family)
MRHVVALMCIYFAGVFAGALIESWVGRCLAHGVMAVVIAVYALRIERSRR